MKDNTAVELNISERLTRPVPLISHGSSIHGSKDLARRPVRFFREISLTWLGIAVTLVSAGLLFWDTAHLMKSSLRQHTFGTFLVQAVFIVIFGFLIYGNLLYQFCRLFYFKRLRRHQSGDKTESESIGGEADAPWVVMLIPSYKEEIAVIRQSLLSCALQDYPHRRVTLLIDNPPNPSDVEDYVLLGKTRQLTEEIQALLDREAQIYHTAYEEFKKHRSSYAFSIFEEIKTLMNVQLQAAQWFVDRAAEESESSHVDKLFVELTFKLRAGKEFERARHLTKKILDIPESSRLNQIEREYRRLMRLFEAEITRFERKQYINLSHESNKAMNLNSYLGLMGKNLKETAIQGKRAIVPCSPNEASFYIPSSEFVLTLDADSLLDPEYTRRLVNVMRQPGNERLGVVQTPYTAVPNAPKTLERVAGATTDMQYIIHQGFTHAKATFWVGANALIRREALEDIVIEEEERGFHVSRYIQDRTVIEDTESSVDMIARGWSLYNYPERLSYSATPADFGSLLIQRRRWANGGLIILPKMLAYIFKRRFHPKVLHESFFRFHYLTSIAAVNLGLIIILAYPFERPLHIFWLPFTAIPYYFLYGRDLVLAGYGLSDLCRVYALNLFLIPVNLGGVFKSIWQFFTKNKIPFSRTPKVMGQTLAPPKYVFFELALCFYCFLSALVDGIYGLWLNASFALLNGFILVYAFYAFFDFKPNTAQLVHSCRRKIIEIRDTIFFPEKILEPRE